MHKRSGLHCEKNSNTILFELGDFTSWNKPGSFWQKYLGSGLEDILVKNEIFGLNAVSQIMKGKSFKRCSLAHMFTYEPMCRFEFSAFLKYMVDKEQLSELVAEELEVSCKNIQQAMKSFVFEERTHEKQQTVKKKHVTKLENISL